MKKIILLLSITLLSTSIFAQSKSESLKTELKKYKDGEALIANYIDKFDTLDFKHLQVSNG